MSRDARRSLVRLAIAAVGGDDHGGTDGYVEELDRLAARAVSSPEEAQLLLEAAATLIALAIGTIALDDSADFVRELDEVDFVIEATTFERTMDEMLATPALTDRPGDPQGGFPG